jgi:hypothetical protein
MILWAETEADADQFLDLIGNPKIFNQIFCAKKGPGSKYLGGKYFVYNLEKKFLSKEIIDAPESIRELTQWCSPDIIISKDNKPLLVIELTFHTLVYNNVAQRIPRIAKSAEKRIPSIIFQKTDYQDNILLSWFCRSLNNLGNIYNTKALPIFFDDKDYDESVLKLKNIVKEIFENKLPDFNSLININQKFSKTYNKETLLYGKKKKKRTWITNANNKIIVNIGVRDNCAVKKINSNFLPGCQGNDEDKKKFRKHLRNKPPEEKGCVWLSKGTGGMDPYPGLVKMSELLLCYNDDFIKTKKVEVHFSKLKKNFWWFKKNEDKEIYLKLIHEFSDIITYSNEYK